MERAPNLVRCLPGRSGLAPRFPSLIELFACLFTWGCLLWRCLLWPAMAMAPMLSRVRMQQPGRAKPRQPARTIRHQTGRTPSSPCPRALHTQGRLWGHLGHCRDTNSREQHYRKQLCSLLGSLPGGSTRLLGLVRLEGEGKEKSIFSLSPSTEHRGRDRRVWIKIPFLSVSCL